MKKSQTQKQSAKVVAKGWSGVWGNRERLVKVYKFSVIR